MKQPGLYPGAYDLSQSALGGAQNYRAQASPGFVVLFKGNPTKPTTHFSGSPNTQVLTLLWMDEILHHVQDMVETIVCCYLQGNHHSSAS